MFTTISNLVKNKFKGILVFGDVHSDYESLKKAYMYCVEHNYFFMSLGDLVDRGPDPFNTVKFMHGLMYEHSFPLAGFTVGNHDDKFRRYHNSGPESSKIRFSIDGKNTLESVGPARLSEFLNIYTEIVEHPTVAGFFHKFDDITLVHAASHPAMWGNTGVFDKTAQSRALVGETNGEKYEDGYPVRLYNWIEEIPSGKTVIVGHDKMPIHNINIVEPMVVLNKTGGKVIFLDTGCGKGGFLSGAVIINRNGKFKIEQFVEFK